MTLSGNNGICAVCRQSRPLVGVIGAEFTRPPPHQQELEDITSSNRTGSNSGRPASSSNKNVDSADWYEAELPSSGSSHQLMNIAENVVADSKSRQQRTSVPNDEKSEKLPAISGGTVALGESSDSIIKEASVKIAPVIFSVQETKISCARQLKREKGALFSRRNKQYMYACMHQYTVTRGVILQDTTYKRTHIIVCACACVMSRSEANAISW